MTHELATIETGGALTVTAGGDLTVRGATVEAGGDATLYAEGDTTIESVQDRRWSATRQGSDRRSETSTETQRTTISAGGELTVGARTGDVTLDAVSLVSGGDTNLVAEQGTVLLLTETDEAGSTRRERQVRRLEWSETNQGRSDETIEHVQLEYGGELRISAGEGVVVEYERDGSLSASLNELTDSPELAWMDQLRGEANVEWQGVEASSESWYRSSSGLTAAGKAAAAQAAAESQKSVAGSEDPGVSSLRVYGAGLPSAAGGGGGGGQLLAGVQGAPRNTIRPLPDPQRKDSSGSESGSSQGGTTDGSDTSTLTLKTVDITEPSLPWFDPFGLGPYGPALAMGRQEQTSSTTVDLGSAEIELTLYQIDSYYDPVFGYWAYGAENDDEPKLAEVLTEVNTLAKEANEKNLCQQQLNMNNPGCGLGQNVVYDPSVYAALDAKSRTVIAPPVDLLCTILGLCLHITAETGKGSAQGDDAETDEPPKGSTAGTPTPRTPTGDKKVPEGSGNLGLRQQLALEEAQSANSERIMEGRINDPRYPDDLWAKMRYVHRSQDGSTIVVHFWENVLTGAREGFKIK